MNESQQASRHEAAGRKLDGSSVRPARRWPGWPFVLLAGLLILVGFLGLDRVFYEQVSLRLNTEYPLDRDFYAVTRPFWLVVRVAFAYGVGGAGAYALIFVLHRERWRAANRMLIAVLVPVVLAFVLEGIIGRLRPNQADSHLAFAPPFSALFQTHQRKVCFPSGEATMAFALAGVLARLFPRSTVAFYVLGGLASVSRLINGAHYLSDVAAGALLGFFCARAIYTYLSTSGPPLLRAPEYR
jgi:membrane-associated phospholipid phosphatase